MSATASAPASSGNLGPGFDCIGLALEVRCTVAAEEFDRWEIEQDGVTSHPGAADLVVRAVSAVAPGPMRLVIDNAIPRSRGLGSSSAVAAAAMTAALRANGERPDVGHVFDRVTELEGHADNAAAAAFGGLVLTRSGAWRRLELWDGFTIVVAIPDSELSTRRARAVLPESIDRATVSRSLGRLGFLVEGLRTGDPEALALAAGDELHEAPRAHLSAITGELIECAMASGARHAAWSGAGPSALVLTTPAEAPSVTAALEAVLDGAGKVERVTPAGEGVL
jgi:homoserine kinase